MARYRFLTTWVLEAPPEAIYDALHDVLRWPEWWTGVVATAELEPGNADGRGGLARYTWRSRIPYSLTFDVRVVEVDRPWLLCGAATGDLAGTGTWRIFAQPGGLTAVTYEWNVRTTQWWMNLVAPLARGIFRANHDWVMRRGGEGLAGLLGARLVVNG